MELPKELIEKLSKAKSIAVITGAGISAESGVPTFRGADGLWKKYRAEELATPYAFKKDPKLVWEWYDWRRGLISKTSPNKGHLAIAEMESLIKDFTLITQNVDGLHRSAGSKNIIEIHGNLWRVKCIDHGHISYNMDVPLKEIPPHCHCGSIVRPDVVWFGESLSQSDINNSYDALRRAEILLVVGTSGIVQPVASFPHVAKEAGALVVEINIEKTPITALADYTLLGPSGEVLPLIVDSIK